MAPADGDSISETYQAYKTSTNCFLSWLWCQYRVESPVDADANKFRSTKDILKAAKVLAKAKSTVPSSVMGFLQNAITKRRHVFNIYQRLGAGDQGHEEFVFRLEEVRDTLIPLMKEPRLSSGEGSKSDHLTPSNLFSYLPTVEDDHEDPSISTSTTHTHRGSVFASSDERAPKIPSVAPPNFRLEDDRLREAFDAAYFLVELNVVHSQLGQYWAEAARGNIPLPLAAWLTNFALYNTARQMPARFVEVCVNLFNQPKFVCGFCSEVSGGIDPAMYVADASRLFLLAQAINDYALSIPEAPKREIQGKKLVCDKPDCMCKFRTTCHSHSADNKKDQQLPQHENEHVRAIFDEVLQDLETGRAIALVEAMKPLECGCFTPICEPFFFIARDFLSQSVPLAPARLVLALNLFFLTDKALLASGENLVRSQYRLQSLRLAIKIRTSVYLAMEAVEAMALDCEKGRIWKRKLQSFHNGLGAYISEKKFDVYHTSPWTVGNHMMEMLTQAFLSGYLINSDWAVISATLHLYNSMRRSVADTPKIPIFDELCQIFIESVFHGSLPERNFCSTFRYIVYHSKVEKNAGPYARSGRSRLQFGGMLPPQEMNVDCWLVDQHYSNHDDDPCFQGQVHGIPYKRTSDHKILRKVKEAQAKIGRSEYMEKAKARVLLELQGPHPIARINFYAVFVLCSKFLNELGRLGKQSMPLDKMELLLRDQLKHELVVGRCEAEVLMESIDEFSTGRQGKRHVARMRSTRDAIQAFNEVDLGVSLPQLMWDI